MCSQAYFNEAHCSIGPKLAAYFPVACACSGTRSAPQFDGPALKRNLVGPPRVAISRAVVGAEIERPASERRLVGPFRLAAYFPVAGACSGTRSPSFLLSLSRSLSHTHTLTLTLSLVLFSPLPLSHAHTLTHTHTHTHSFSRSLALSRPRRVRLLLFTTSVTPFQPSAAACGALLASRLLTTQGPSRIMPSNQDALSK